jgi:hypothetical protein
LKLSVKCSIIDAQILKLFLIFYLGLSSVACPALWGFMN